LTDTIISERYFS